MLHLRELVKGGLKAKKKDRNLAKIEQEENNAERRIENRAKFPEGKQE